MEWAVAGLVLVGLIGLAVVATARAGDRDAATERARLAVAARQAAWPPSPYPMLTHYTDHRQITMPATPALPVPGSLPENLPALPGVTQLGELLDRGWRPTPGAILLGLGPGGVPITVGLGDALCHVVTAGRTGSGKSNLLRLLLTQLLAAGAEVYLCDPHFTPRHPATGEDWRILAAATAPRRALTDRAAIGALVDGLGPELDRRLARLHAGQVPGPPRFYVFEELPLLADGDKAFMGKLGRLLREGRKLGLFVITAAQDMLISTLGGSAGLRSQFATIYYGGGDPYTARALLAAKVPEPPGRGVCYLRHSGAPEPALVRVPLVSNGDIEALLGAPSGPAAPLPGHFRVLAPEAGPEVPTADGEGRRDAVRALVRAGVPSSDIIRQVWGATGGRGYQAAAQELTSLLAELVQ